MVRRVASDPNSGGIRDQDRGQTMEQPPQSRIDHNGLDGSRGRIGHSVQPLGGTIRVYAAAR